MAVGQEATFSDPAKDAWVVNGKSKNMKEHN